MGRRNKARAVMVLAVMAAVAAAASTAPQTRPDAAKAGERAAAEPTVADLAWIAGDWRAERDDGQMLQEHWLEPMHGCMIGAFRWIREGQPWLYEFLLLEDTPDGPVFYLRHFGRGSKAWEAKDAPLAYSLVKVDGRRVVFEDPQRDSPRRFVFERPDGDTLIIRLQDVDDVAPDGGRTFRYTRHK